MTEMQWSSFSAFREALKRRCEEWNAAFAEELAPLQQAASASDTPAYPLETPVVYNQALDDIVRESQIRYIVIGDNPGKDEQRAQNRRYLVGQSGKIAQGFFARNPELHTDFRANVIILNKTPVHTAKTAHLRFLSRQGSARVRSLISESTSWMAEETARLHRALYESGASLDAHPELWLVGYTELKARGIFTGYRDALKAAYTEGEPPELCEAWQAVRVFRHFSMNQFTIELNKALACGTALPEALKQIGLQHRAEIFGL